MNVWLLFQTGHPRSTAANSAGGPNCVQGETDNRCPLFALEGTVFDPHPNKGTAPKMRCLMDGQEIP